MSLAKFGARYRCLACAHEWVGYGGPEQNKARLDGDEYAPSDPTQCRRCGHLYVKWTNYESMVGAA